MKTKKPISEHLFQKRLYSLLKNAGIETAVISYVIQSKARHENHGDTTHCYGLAEAARLRLAHALTHANNWPERHYG
jgi:hypothetical protein